MRKKVFLIIASRPSRIPVTLMVSSISCCDLILSLVNIRSILKKRPQQSTYRNDRDSSRVNQIHKTVMWGSVCQIVSSRYFPIGFKIYRLVPNPLSNAASNRNTRRCLSCVSVSDVSRRTVCSNRPVGPELIHTVFSVFSGGINPIWSW